MKTGERYILMLEDDSDDREITETYFAEHNYNVGVKFVTQADDVLLHLEQCTTSQAGYPGLILIDKYADVHSGIEVLKTIKAHPIYVQIPVVMISGSDLRGDIAESYLAGANSYIVKPDRMDLTLKKISTFISYWFEVAELPLTAVNVNTFSAL